jgi:hypothetical protein
LTSTQRQKVIVSYLFDSSQGQRMTNLNAGRRRLLRCGAGIGVASMALPATRAQTVKSSSRNFTVAQIVDVSILQQGRVQGFPDRRPGRVAGYQ